MLVLEWEGQLAEVDPQGMVGKWIVVEGIPFLLIDTEGQVANGLGWKREC